MVAFKGSMNARTKSGLHTVHRDRHSMPESSVSSYLAPNLMQARSISMSRPAGFPLGESSRPSRNVSQPQGRDSRVDPAEPVTEWPWAMPQELVGCRPAQPAEVETVIHPSMTSRGQYGYAYCMKGPPTRHSSFLYMYPGRAPFRLFLSSSQCINDIDRLQPLFVVSCLLLFTFRHFQTQSLVSHLVTRCIAFVFHPAEALPVASLFSDTKYPA